MANTEPERNEILAPYVAPAVVLEADLEIRAGTVVGAPGLFGDLLDPGGDK